METLGRERIHNSLLQACRGVSDVESALVLLRRLWWEAQTENGYVVASDINAAPAMNRALVEAGFEVDHLTVKSASLEEMFLKMTTSEVN